MLSSDGFGLINQGVAIQVVDDAETFGFHFIHGAGYPLTAPETIIIKHHYSA